MPPVWHYIRRAPSKLRKLYFSERAEKLHIGSGPETFPGWVNIDNVRYPGVRVLDVTYGLPFKDVKFIYAEHFIEHLHYNDARYFLRECRRVLRDDGVLRLSTPNLDWVWRSHYRRDATPDMEIADGFGLNLAFRGWGHQFLYNFGTLAATLREAGFSDVVRQQYGESAHGPLRGIERHATNPDVEGVSHHSDRRGLGPRRRGAELASREQRSLSHRCCSEVTGHVSTRRRIRPYAIPDCYFHHSHSRSRGLGSRRARGHFGHTERRPRRRRHNSRHPRHWFLDVHHLQSRHCHPKCFFGGVPAASVILTSDTTLTVVTPPHPAGLVAVTVVQFDGSAGIANAFTFSGDVFAALEPILVPVFSPPVRGQFAPHFRTTVVASHKGFGPRVILYGLDTSCFLTTPVLGPEDARVIEPNGPVVDLPPDCATWPAKFFYVPIDQAKNVTLNARVRDVSRSDSSHGTEIPIVRVSEFRQDNIVLLNVPLEARFRNTLRIYSPDKGNVAVTIDGAEQVVSLQPRTRYVRAVVCDVHELPAAARSYDCLDPRSRHRSPADADHDTAVADAAHLGVHQRHEQHDAGDHDDLAGLEKARLPRRRAWLVSEMFVCKPAGDAAAWRPLQEADLDQIRFVQILDRAAIFGDRCASEFTPTGPPLKRSIIVTSSLRSISSSRTRRLPASAARHAQSPDRSCPDASPRRNRVRGGGGGSRFAECRASVADLDRRF
jgi:predicted SAM-dependent methyltransferase